MFFIRYCVEKLNIVALVLVFLVFWGINSYIDISKREDPDIKSPVGVVVTVFPGASPEKVENLITIPLEEAIDTIDEVDYIRSISKPSLSLIYVNLTDEENIDNHKAWTDIRIQIDKTKTNLPQEIFGPDLNDKFADTAAQIIAISSSSLSSRKLKDYAETIKDKLVKLDNVGRAEIFGAKEEVVNIEGSLRRLGEYGISISQMINAMKARNIIYGGGDVRLGDSQVNIQPTGEFKNQSDIENVVIGVSASTSDPIFLKDIFDVKRTYKDPPSILCSANGIEAVLIIVQMKKGKNIIELGKEVEECWKNKIEPNIPNDLMYEIMSDQPTSVTNRVKDFVINLVSGMILVVIVSLIAFGLRTGIVIALALPLTMIITGGVMPILNVEVEQISIAALIIALGMIVDNAIVISDNVHQYYAKGYSGQESGWRAAKELAIPVLTSTLTTVGAFAPMLLITGKVYYFIRSLPLVICTALILSYLLAMLVTPGLTSKYAIKGDRANNRTSINNANNSTNSIFDRLVKLYKPFLLFSLRHKKSVISFAIIMLIISILFIPLIGLQFFPYAERNQFLIMIKLPEGSSIQRTKVVSEEVEEYLREEEKISGFLTVCGRGMPRFYYNLLPELYSPNIADILVNTTSSEATKDVITKLRKTLRDNIAGAIVIIKELEQGPPVDAPVAFRIYGHELEFLRSQAEIVKDILSKEYGTLYVKDDIGQDYFQLTVDIDEVKANRMGLTNLEVAVGLNAHLSGYPVTTFREEDEKIEIVIRSPEKQRNTIEDIENFKIVSEKTGKSIFLKQIADVKYQWQVPEIRRRSLKKAIQVSCYLEDRLAEDVTQSVWEKIKTIPILTKGNVEIAGQEEERAKTFAQVTGVFVVSFIIMVMILSFQFGSISTAFIIIMSLPLALIGAILGLVISNNPFGFMSFLGVVSLAGIVVNNAIVLIDFIRSGVKEGMELRDAIISAGIKRLRPILLTTITTVFGLVPLAINGGSLFSPMAWVIMTGLITSTFLTLIVIPVVYETNENLTVERIKNVFTKRKTVN